MFKIAFQPQFRGWFVLPQIQQNKPLHAAIALRANAVSVAITPRHKTATARRGQNREPAAQCARRAVRPPCSAPARGIIVDGREGTASRRRIAGPAPSLALRASSRSGHPSRPPNLKSKSKLNAVHLSGEPYDMLWG